MSKFTYKLTPSENDMPLDRWQLVIYKGEGKHTKIHTVYFTTFKFMAKLRAILYRANEMGVTNE